MIWRKTKRIWLDIQVDWWFAHFLLMRAQYGDCNYGENTRRKELESHAIKTRYLNAPAPYHAGFYWG